MCAETELLLMNASRAQLVREVIRPALASGKAVLCDRFFDSTIAYQAFGRQLDTTQVQRIIDFAIGETRPDLTLFLRVPLAISEERRASRGQQSRDRLEEEDRAFFHRVEQGYDAIVANSGPRVRVVDANQPVEKVAEEIWKWVEPLATLPAAQGDRAWKTVGEYRTPGPG
jgi:dTMP kinase